MSKSDPRRKILWTFGILVILCPLSLCGIGYYFFRSWFISPAGELPHEIQLARSAGIPLEPDDLRPKPPIPKERNAAILYKPLFAEVDHLFKSDRDLRTDCTDVNKGAATDVQSKHVAQVLAKQHGLIARLVAATRRPDCDFQYRYEEGFNVLFPEFAQGKVTVTLLCSAAHLQADRGDVSGALDTVAAAHRIGVHVGTVPVLIGLLVDISIDSIAMNEFAHVLQRCSRSQALLDKAQRTLDGFGPVADLRYAFGGEVVLGRFGIQKIRTTRDVAELSGEKSSRDGVSLPSAMVKGFEARFLSTWRKVFTTMPRDQKDWRVTRDALKKVIDEVEADHSPANVLNVILFPVFSDTSLAIAAQQARRNLAACSLRLLRDHLRKGAYPDTLPAYGPIGIDPLDGKPLRYSRAGNGFLIYSIDRDLEDNGGRKRKGNQKGDIALTFN